jgi:hypothetical protein
MALMPDNLRLTAEQQAELDKIQAAAKVRHAKARLAAKAKGRNDYPALPFECSWVFEMKFRRGLMS